LNIALARSRELPAEHALDALTIPAPLLDLVEIAMVRDQGLVGFLV